MKLFGKTSFEPYRYLFPLGAVFALLGASVWLTIGKGQHYATTATTHAQLMVGAFLLTFVSGFLMTAVPKMTASFPAREFEIVIAITLAVLNAIFALNQNPTLHYISAALSIAALAAFFVRRFLARTKPIPPFFPFVILALLSGLAGAVLLASSAGQEGQFLFLLGKKLFFETMILLLVLGIGSRLIPVISGRGAIMDSGGQTKIRNACLALFLIFGIVIEVAGYSLLGGAVKFCVALFVAWHNWGLFARSPTKSRLAIGMRVAGIMVLAGMLMSVLKPELAVHWMHLTYVGGFGLMTLTVASRVTLAHGSYDLAYEWRSRSVWITGVLILMAAATRVSAPYLGENYFSHLVFAALLWMAAVLVWSAAFVRRMFKNGDLSEPECK